MPELERESRVIGKHGEESREPPQVEVKVRLKLKQDRPELLAESNGRLDDHIDGLLLDGKAFDVADVTTALDGEQESGRRQFSPCFKSLGRRSEERRVGKECLTQC